MSEGQTFIIFLMVLLAVSISGAALNVAADSRMIAKQALEASHE